MNKYTVTIVILGALVFLGTALWRREVVERKSRTPFDADPYIARSIAEARALAADAELSTIRAQLVDPDGKVQPGLDGRLALSFRSPARAPASPPTVPGAPPPRGQLQCPRIRVATYVYAGAKARRLVESEAKWVDDGRCEPSLASPLRCTVVALWRRALADGAPSPAYADLSLDTADGRRRWRFEITDKSGPLQRTLFLREWNDDCSQ